MTALRLRLENLEPALDPRAHDSLTEAVAETLEEAPVTGIDATLRLRRAPAPAGTTPARPATRAARHRTTRMTPVPKVG